MGWREFKERVLRPSYLPASFTFGALTIGLRVAAANYTVTNSVRRARARARACRLRLQRVAYQLAAVLQSARDDALPSPAVAAPGRPAPPAAQPLEFLATAASTGVMCMALAWVLFDFTDTPPPGGNFSSPRK